MRIFTLDTMLRDSLLADRLTEEARRQVLDRAKSMECDGYDLETAMGTLELLIREGLHHGAEFFEVLDCEVRTRMAPGFAAQSTASVTLEVQGRTRCSSVTGDGPIHAMDLCLRQCLFQVYPVVAHARLTDYQLRVLEPDRGTAAKARVWVKWSDAHSTWVTMGVSENVLEASWLALVEGVRLELMRLGDEDESVLSVLEGYSWESSV